MTWLAILFCAFGAIYAFVARRVAIRVLLVLKPQTGDRRTIRPGLLVLVGPTLVVSGAIGVTSVFIKVLDPRPERVVATAPVNGVEVPTEPDGPTSFATAMLVAGAALVAGVAVGGLGGLNLTPPIAFVVQRAIGRGDHKNAQPPTPLTAGPGRLGT